MSQRDFPLAALAPALDDRTGSRYGGGLVARRNLQALERLIEPLHPLPIVDAMLLGIANSVVGDGQAFTKNRTEFIPRIWLNHALCRSQRVFIFRVIT